MVNMPTAPAAVKPARKARHKPARSLRWFRTSDAGAPVCGVLTVTEEAARDCYHVERLDAPGCAAYHLTKLDEGRILPGMVPYAVRFDAAGHHSCECKGHLRWGHKTRCRHLAGLLLLTSRGDLPPVPSPLSAIDDDTLEAVEALDAEAALAECY